MVLIHLVKVLRVKLELLWKEGILFVNSCFSPCHWELFWQPGLWILELPKEPRISGSQEIPGEENGNRPEFSPGEFMNRMSLVGCCPRGSRRKLNMIQGLTLSLSRNQDSHVSQFLVPKLLLIYMSYYFSGWRLMDAPLEICWALSTIQRLLPV